MAPRFCGADAQYVLYELAPGLVVRTVPLRRPFTREELKLKTIRGIQKKQEKSKKAGRRMA